MRLSLPPYASEEDVEFILRAVEFVADHGTAFVPLYRFGWRDGVWRHVERPAGDVEPIALTVEAVMSAAHGLPAGGDEAPLSEERLRAERARYFDEAERLVAELEARWKGDAPEWNRPTGRSDVDGLVWFRYAHADDLPERGTASGHAEEGR